MIRTVDNVVARIRVYYQQASVNYVTSSFSAAHGLAGPNVYLSAGYAYAGAQQVQQPRTRVEIDLNVRVRGNDTFVGFEDVHGPITVGEAVEVYESESGVSGEGKVTEIDGERELVYLSVDWSSLSEGGTSSHGEMSLSGTTRLLFVGPPPTAGTFPSEPWIEMVPRPCLMDIGGGDNAMWITASLGESRGLSPCTYGEPYVEMRQNVVFRNSMVVAA